VSEKDEKLFSEAKRLKLVDHLYRSLSLVRTSLDDDTVVDPKRVRTFGSRTFRQQEEDSNYHKLRVCYEKLFSTDVTDEELFTRSSQLLGLVEEPKQKVATSYLYCD